MPEAVVPRSIQLPPEVDQEIVVYRASRGLQSFSKALVAMLAERKAMLEERRG
jgi:hypothetical protein